ncbi:MAG: pseudouridine-5'-phosphate glycosidase [Candidatus Dormibacter sp.]
MPIAIAPEIQTALRSGVAVVALESAVITHGLPRDAALDSVQRQWDACRTAGAVPAVVAVFEGRLLVGLSLTECAALADHGDAVKVSPWNLASSLKSPGFGGTTVAATVAAATLAGIRVLSTGGIGGVHPGDGNDVSADLTELGKHPVCVVCAGPKSTLDRVATLEYLETLGVAVVGWRSVEMAGFLAQSSGIRLPASMDTVDDMVALLREHWALTGAGVVLCQALPATVAIPTAELEAVSDSGDESGGLRTPAELKRLQERLGSRVIQANVALLEQNAVLAAQLAVALAAT